MNVKKIRYDSWDKYSWIGILILCEFISLKEELTIESFIIGVIITIAVSVPVEIIALRNSIKYDDEKIYFYKFKFFKSVIEINHIFSVQISIAHWGNVELRFLNIICKDGRIHRFNITYLNEKDISSMENFIQSSHPDIRILEDKRSLF